MKLIYLVDDLSGLAIVKMSKIKFKIGGHLIFYTLSA